MDLDLQGYPPHPHPQKSAKSQFFQKNWEGVPPTLSLNFTNKNMKFNPEIAFFSGGLRPQTPH